MSCCKEEKSVKCVINGKVKGLKGNNKIMAE